MKFALKFNCNSSKPLLKKCSFFFPFFWVDRKTDDVCSPFTFYEKTTPEQRWKLYVMLYICIFREIK